jgi:OOP family OmpA-OmpF porin
MLRRLLLPALALLAAGPALALDLPERAVVTADLTESFGSYALPTGAWHEGTLPTLRAEGPVSRQALRIPGPHENALQILSPLREQLRAEGYDILFECKTRGCGGFDFRFTTEVLPEPDMHVDLGEFRFLSAKRDGAEGPEYLSLMTSRSQDAGYVQIIRVGGPAGTAETIRSTKTPDATAPLPRGLSPADNALGQRLDSAGTAILADLEFATGAAELSPGSYGTLDALAAYLKANPERIVVLVGHTDSQGSLEGNIALSKRRAQSVAARLVALGVEAERVSSDGVGFLSPLASNLTEEGRRQNRRVEVVLTAAP